ncbi:MAG TPA: YciI family protein [Thermoanaerobaculia bacterium]|nr:YciI family protein [Thermoanaerobaculia bacterium]
MTTRLAALALLALLPVAAPAVAEEPPAQVPAAEQAAAEQSAPPPPVFEQYQLVLLKRPAAAPDYPPERVAEIQRGHLAHMTALGEEGKLVIAGPFGDQEDESLRGLALYQVGSIEEARRLASGDPAVVAGRLEVEVLTWYVEEGYMVFPKRPAAEPAGAAPASDEAAPGASR